MAIDVGGRHSNYVNDHKFSKYLLVVICLSTALFFSLNLYVDKYALSPAESVKAKLDALALSVAIASFVTTGYGVINGIRWNSRQTTLRAWNEWYFENSESMKKLGARFQGGPTRKQAELMLSTKAPSRIALRSAGFRSLKDMENCHKSIISILNGLEGVAVGVQADVYDVETIRQAGGKVVESVYDRYKTYIDTYRDVRRQLASGHSRAYRELESLKAELHDRDMVERTKNSGRSPSPGQGRADAP